MNRINIAIDGYSSCGKSTLAKALASRLGYVYVDSGAMYRAVTLYFIRNRVNAEDALEVERALEDIDIYFEKPEGLVSSQTYLNGENVESAIREMEISRLVSEVSAIPAVREAMVAQQRAIGRNKGVVMDGRDIGTVVFPDAELKIFMVADLEIRARRRYLELRARDIDITYEEVLENVKKRDNYDSNRAHSPLSKAPDALVLDNSHLSEEEQLKWALGKAMEAIEKANKSS